MVGYFRPPGVNEGNRAAIGCAPTVTLHLPVKISDTVVAHDYQILTCVCVCVPVSLRADIDECERDEHDCQPSQECINSEGAFTCQCPDGYRKVGTECIGETNGVHPLTSVATQA